jgi:hypothetical protein
MSAVSLTRPRITTAAPVRSLLPALAAQEARRLMRHPVMLAAFGLLLFNVVDGVVTGTIPREAFEIVSSMSSFFPGVFGILAANLVATRDLRAGSQELLAPAPGRPGERVAALCLASFVPALLALVIAAATNMYFLADGRFVDPPGLWHVMQSPATVLGGCLLGIMLGVWLPARGTAVIALVAMVAANVWLSSLGDHGRLFGPTTMWAAWSPIFPTDWDGLLPGNPAGHVVYLLGLCGMAASAAVLRVAERRTPVVLAGVLSVLLAVVGGIGQLP